MENKDERKTFCCSMHGDNGQPRETGRCEWCRKNMHPHLKKNPMENKDWKEEFREYFDKVLKAKKPTIENLDREILVNAVSRILKSKQEEMEKAMDKKMLPETEMKGGVDYMCGKAYNKAIEDLKPIISNLLK